MTNCLEIIPESVQLVKMTDEEYFSSKYSDYISNSKLSLIDPTNGGSPEKYKEGFKGSYNESFELGSAVHGVLLQPEEFYIPNIYKPTGKLGYTAELTYKYRQQGLSIMDSIIAAATEADYYKGKLSPKRLKTFLKESIPFYLQRMKFKEEPDRVPLFLSKPIFDTYESCLISINQNKDFLNILYPDGEDLMFPAESYNEYAILCEVKVNDKIVKVKAKLDNFTIDDGTKTITLNDVKTTGKPAGYFMGNEWYNPEINQKVWIEGSFEKFRYYRQVGMYLWLLQNVMRLQGKTGYKYKSHILLVETRPDYQTKIYKINSKWVKRGLKEFKELLILASNECD